MRGFQVFRAQLDGRGLVRSPLSVIFSFAKRGDSILLNGLSGGGRLANPASNISSVVPVRKFDRFGSAATGSDNRRDKQHAPALCFLRRCGSVFGLFVSLSWSFYPWES